MPKKTEREDHFGFFNTHFVVKLQNNEGGTLWWKKISKNVAQCRKKFESGDPVMYVTRKKRKTFLV